MQFKEGTPVYTADEQKVGEVERFVLDPRGQQIIGLIVRKGFLFTEDKVIPVNMVGLADEDRVVLYANAGDPDDFPPFEEKHYVSPNVVDLGKAHQAPLRAPLYHYPPLGTATWYGATYAVPKPTVIERNIPEGTVPVKTGANVVSRDGHHVGDVERIFTDAKTDEVTHFSIKQGLLFQEEKLLPATWVDSASEDKVQLAVSSQTLEKIGNQ